MKYIVVVLALAVSASYVFANCGSLSCPVDIRPSMAKNRFQVGVNFEYIDQSAVYVGSSRSSVGFVPEHHDEIQTLNRMTTVFVQYGLTDWLGLRVDTPMVSRQHSHIHNHHGEKIFDSWDFTGLGDISVVTQWKLKKADAQNGLNWRLDLGVKLPTGKTDQGSSSGVAESPIQPGSGSTDVLIGTEFSAPVATVQMMDGLYAEVPLSFSASSKLTGVGTDGYRQGSSLLLALCTEYPLVKSFSALFQVQTLFVDRASAKTEKTENTGGRYVFITPGVRWNITPALQTFAALSWTAFRDVNVIQITPDLQFKTGMSLSL
ncbi:MAG: transporter [Candidatus Margulisiibacteriota bacterium]